MMPPTVITLRELAECADISSVFAGALRRRLEPVRPRFVDAEDGVRLELPGGEIFS